MKLAPIYVDDAVGENTALIVRHPTGVEWTAQTGGIACNHPTVFGFVLSLGDFGQGFDDCSYGCYSISYEQRVFFIMALSDLFTEWGKANKLQISFNHARKDELQEGWWPVILNGPFSDMSPVVFEDDEAYIHTGNCD